MAWSAPPDLARFDDDRYIDDCRSNVTEEAIMKLRKARPTNERVEFCERCSSVCDSYCRANEVLRAHREHVLFFGARF